MDCYFCQIVETIGNRSSVQLKLIKNQIPFFAILAIGLLGACRGISKEDVVLHDGFELLIPEDSNEKLSKWKAIALEQGIISDDLKEYVPARWVHKGDTVDVEIRLKGDWTDHLENDLPSYRIKLADGASFKGIETFSIQDPMTRNYGHEWFMHQLFESENMLATTYFFSPGLINGEGGTFAVEQHFESNLLTSRGRVKGPILKIDEGGLWEARLIGSKVEHSYPIFQSAAIKPFKKSKIARDKDRRKEFETASNLVAIYKTNNFKASELFDTKKAGQYFALLELGYVKHSHIWHNQRFYYNPISAKLEFIGFDMNPGHEEEIDSMTFIRQELNRNIAPTGHNLVWPFLCDADFREAYTLHLKRFSTKQYLDSMSLELEASIDLTESLLERNEAMYDFDLDFYYNRAAVIRENMGKLDADWDRFMKTVNPEKLSYNKKYFPLEGGPILASVGLNVYQDEKKEGFDLTFVNYHRTAIELIGFSPELNAETYVPFSESVRLGPFETKKVDASLKTKVKAGFVHYRIPELGKHVLKAEVMPWKAPELKHPRMKLSKKFLRTSEWYDLKGKQLTFRSGDLVIDELIYIPEGIEVLIPAGTNIRFEKEAGLIVNDIFKVSGTEEQEVQLDFDKDSYGLLVLNSSNVDLKQLAIKGASALDYKGWKTEAGLTISGSVVQMENVDVSKSRADYAIQLVDCHGRIEGLRVRKAGKDGITVSGSTLDLNSVQLQDVDGVALEVSRSDVKMTDCEAKEVEELLKATAQSRIQSYGLKKVGQLGACRILEGSTYVTESGFYPASSAK